MDLTTVLLLVGAYLFGAVPFGLLIGWVRGKDVREHGSRNIGATNVGRVVGRGWGYACLLLDVLKGFVPTLVAGLILVRNPIDAAVLGQWLLVAVVAVLGHVFPVYLRFRGGKGVATTVGVALGIYPYFTVAMAVALVGYAVARLATGLVSVGSLTIAIVFPLSFFVYMRTMGLSLAEFWPLLAVAVLLAILIVVRHRANIVRLLRGEELRVG